MHSITLEDYLSQVQQISCRLDGEPGALQELLQFIERSKDGAKDEPCWAAFFSGEYAFYNAQYECALNHYLKAQGIERFQFYCYRASAHMFQAKGNVDKALKFIKKSLDIYPNDHFSKLLFHSLSSKEQPDFEPRDREEAEQPIGTFQEDPVFVKEILEDKIMNTDTSLCTYSSTSSPGARSILIQRLYPAHEKTSASASSSPAIALKTNTQITHLEDKTAAEHAAHVKCSGSGHELDLVIEKFYEFQSRYLYDYLQHWKNRAVLPDHCLYAFHGWGKQPDVIQDLPRTASDAMPFFFAEKSRKATGGFYIRWNNKGIVINPSRHFLDRFHKAGLHIRDIDHVIVTHEQRDDYADIKEIYELNGLLTSLGEGAHLIHYYLNQTAYQELTTVLKPQSKQERQAIHSLELFMDSPETEHLALDVGIDLHYFAVTSHPLLSQEFVHKKERHHEYSPILGIRLELACPNDSSSDKPFRVNMGYISGAAWSPFAGRHFAGCDVMLAGVGNTSRSDYNMNAHLENCLGYFGVSSLLESIRPKLLLCTEFGGREGDIRLEMVRKMRADMKSFAPQLQTAILPVDIGLFIDLKSFGVKCSATGELVDPSEISVTRSAGIFGPLHYLSRLCCLRL